jgi:hypothetical protein
MHDSTQWIIFLRKPATLPLPVERDAPEWMDPVAYNTEPDNPAQFNELYFHKPEFHQQHLPATSATPAGRQPDDQ